METSLRYKRWINCTNIRHFSKFSWYQCRLWTIVYGAFESFLKNVKENYIKTFQETDPTQEIELTHESIVACTSAKFVQLNAAENGQVFGFGFRKEDDRQTFQNIIQVKFKTLQLTK